MRRIILISLTLGLAVFLGWRFLRPMQIFVVSPAFERPVSTAEAPAMFGSLSARECAECHQEFFAEWSTSIHSQAWTDPYFQVDWQFEGSPQICKNCHIPLDRQQEHTVLGFRDQEKLDPILEANDKFDKQLQHEGVTCAACHLRDGKILGVLGLTDSPHAVETLDNANRICIGCHVVSGERWDTFFKFPPCGTVAEIQSGGEPRKVVGSGEFSATELADLGCVECHMPLQERPLVAGGSIRKVRQHLWRGGHDPEMVTRGLTVNFSPPADAATDNDSFVLAISNTGAAHYIPTGTPDRHLTVALRLLDTHNRLLLEQLHVLKRRVMWRPFIVDLWDTRLPRGEQREYTLRIPDEFKGEAATVEATVTYHLLDEARRQRIAYQNETPIQYPIYRKAIKLNP